jgi:hypothetical protein
MRLVTIATCPTIGRYSDERTLCIRWLQDIRTKRRFETCRPSWHTNWKWRRYAVVRRTSNDNVTSSSLSGLLMSYTVDDRLTYEWPLHIIWKTRSNLHAHYVVCGWQHVKLCNRLNGYCYEMCLSWAAFLTQFTRNGDSATDKVKISVKFMVECDLKLHAFLHNVYRAYVRFI